MSIRQKLKELKNKKYTKEDVKRIHEVWRNEFKNRPHASLNEGKSNIKVEFKVDDDGDTIFTDGYNYLIIGNEDAMNLSYEEKMNIVFDTLSDFKNDEFMKSEYDYWVSVLKLSGMLSESKWKLPPVTKEMKMAAEAEVLRQQESLKEEVEDKTGIDAYLNPRTRKVWNAREVKWVDRPVTWNKLIKLPLDRKDLMTMNYFDLKNEYDIDEIDITTDEGYYISDNYSDYHSGEGISVCKEKGYPYKRFVNKNNETAIITFKNLQDAYDFCLKNIKGE